MKAKHLAGLAVGVLVGMMATTTYASYITVVESPFGNATADYLDRGFYVENYGADNLVQVTLQYLSRGTGIYNTSLTVRLQSYDGTIVGETKYLSTFLEDNVFQQIVYDFGGVNLPSGSLLTFTQELISYDLTSGTEDLYYDLGVSPHPQITETHGTNPPLDSWRRDQVGGGDIGWIAPVPEVHS